MTKNYLLIFLLLLLYVGGHAQSRIITGTVTDSATHETLVGVTITVKGSTNGAVTDNNGKFIIRTNNLENVTLGAKYIGYRYQEVVLKPGVNRHDFILTEVKSDLNEVVVTGYGTTLKSKLLGAVSEIKAADVEDIPVANLGTALANRLPGIGVGVASGKPGATTRISIRNPTTFSATQGITSDPLFVIDGLIVQKSDFDNLDASLVESISFLKDAQAAIYGAAGDKGVVLVTTKRGKPGKARISYTGYFGTSDAAFTPKILNGYQLATFLNDNYDVNNTAQTSRFSQADLNFLATNPYKSWYSQLWHSSQTKRHTINISGGTDKVTFFAGGSYYDEGGNFGETSIKKYNIRSGMTAKITDNVTAYVSLNTSLSTDYRNGSKSEDSDTQNYTVKAIYLTPGWVPLTINGLPVAWNGPNPPGLWNPLAYFNSGSYTTSTSQSLNLNSSLEWKPNFLQGLTAKVQYGKTNYSGNSKNYYPSYQVYQFAGAGQNGLLFGNTVNSIKTVSNSDQILAGTGFTSNYELIGSVDYGRSFGKHTFDVLGVVEQTESHSDTYNVYRTGQQIPGIDQFFAYNNGTTTIQGITPAESGKRSYLVRANYDYASKYLVQFIGREDGSANFPPDKRWGFFPSVGLGWRVGEEKFFKEHLAKYINTLKIRFDVGLVGDDRVNGYQYKARFTPYSGTMLFGNNVVNGLDPNILPNTNITWEHARTENLGFDATFLNDRLSVTVDIWNRHVYDGFHDISSLGYPWTLGVNSGLINYDSANSWGSEFSIGYQNRINKDWGWNANVNFAFSNSQIIKAYYSTGALGTPLEYQNVTIGELSKYYTGSNYGLIAKGIIRTQGQLDAILAKNPNYTIEGQKPQLGFMDFEDVNHDGKITAAGDEIPMYSSIAPVLGLGMTFGVSYRTLRLSVNSALSLGGKVFVSGGDKKAPSTTSSAPAFWADHWTPSNPNAQYPRSDAPDVTENSTFWARNGTTWYINNATLSYTLPKSWSDRLKIPELRFVVSGNNLWSIINPFDYKDSRQGDIYNYPTLRTISFGLNLSL